MPRMDGSPADTTTDKPLTTLPPGTIPRAVDMEVDVLVVGLGPGGLVAARDFAKQGFTVLGIDRKQDIGSPKRCAEGVSDVGLAHCGVEPDPAWAYGRIEGAALYAPSGTRVEMVGPDTYGWVIERKIFEKHLARDAILAGAKVMPKTQCTGLLKTPDGAVAGVEAEFMGKRFQIRARLTIGADGIDSMVGKWSGLRTLNRVRDYHAGFQYEMVGVEGIEEWNWLHLYFGEDVAPKGYVWIFPKGDGVANVGIGVLAKESSWGNRAQDYLDRWIERNPDLFRNASVTEINGSGIPVSSRVPEPIADGVMLVGDAAQLVNPIHGGGIIIAMSAAQIAARVGGEALRNGDVSKAALQPYVDEYWSTGEGAVTEKLLRLRYFSENLSDKDFERLASILDGEVVLELTDAKFPTFVKLMLKHFPKMAPLVRKYMLAVRDMEEAKAKAEWDEVDELLAEAESQIAA